MSIDLKYPRVLTVLLSITISSIAGCSRIIPTDQGAVMSPGTNVSVFTKTYDGLARQEAIYSEIAFQITAPPTRGTLTGQLPNVTFEPDIDYLSGIDSFTYTAQKGTEEVEEATVYFTVTDRLVSHLELPGGLVFDGQAVGNRAFLASGLNGMQVVDITNPAAPSLIGSYDPQCVECLISTIQKVAVSDNIAYLLDISSGLLSVDVTIPQTPALLNTLATSRGLGDVAVLETVGGTIVFLVDLTEGLFVIDADSGGISGQLAEIAHFPNYTGSGLHIFENTLFINGNGITKLDITTPQTPVLVGSTADDSNFTLAIIADLLPIDANRVYFAGTITNIAAGNIRTHFGIMDLSNTSALVIAQQAGEITLGASVAISTNTTSGLNQAFVVDSGAIFNEKVIPTVKVLDVTDSTTLGLELTVSEQIITPGVENSGLTYARIHAGPRSSFSTDNGLVIVADAYRGITILDGN